MSEELRDDKFRPTHSCLVLRGFQLDALNYPEALHRFFCDSAKFLLTIILVCPDASLLPTCLFPHTQKIICMKPTASCLNVLTQFSGTFSPDSTSAALSSVAAVHSKMDEYMKVGFGSEGFGCFAVLTPHSLEPFASPYTQTSCSIEFGLVEMKTSLTTDNPKAKNVHATFRIIYTGNEKLF